ADAVNHGSFARVRFRHYHMANASLAGGQRSGKSAAHAAHCPVERKLAEKDVGVERFAEEGSLTTDQTEGHGQIEGGTFLANIRRRQIHGDALIEGILKTAIAQRGLDALATFLYGDVRQADHCEGTGILALLRTDVDFHLDQIGVYTKHGGAERFE